MNEGLGELKCRRHFVQIRISPDAFQNRLQAEPGFVSEKAGVSVSVVSRVLNNSGYVAKDKKERVVRIAADLGYYPNPVAMSLQLRKTRQIVFYCKDLRNLTNIEMYHGMMEVANKHNYISFSGRCCLSLVQVLGKPIILLIKQLPAL